MASHSSFIQAYHLSSGYLSFTGLYLKFRLYGVGYPATEKRFFVSVWMLGVVRSFETLKPMLVRPVWPFAARKKFG
jgi:hypothetical protein